MLESHIKPGAENVHSDVIDFTFLGLEDIESLRSKETRAGRRKPIEDLDDEEEEKNPGLDDGADDEAKAEDDKEQEREEVFKDAKVSQV